MKLSKQHPMTVYQRALLLELISEVEPEVIKEFNRQIVECFPEQDEKTGDVVEYVQMDWEYALFTASMKELSYLVTRLEKAGHIKFPKLGNKNEKESPEPGTTEDFSRGTSEGLS